MSEPAIDKAKLRDMLKISDKPEVVADAIESIAGGDVVKPSPTALKLDQWGIRKGRELLEENDRLKASELAPLDVADFHGAAFEPTPELAKRCDDDLRHKFVGKLLETNEYKALHKMTALSALASELATVAFGDQFAKLREEQKKEAEKRAEREAKGEKSKPGEVEEACDRAVTRSVARGLKDARTEVEECREACNGLGIGAGGGKMDLKRMAEAFHRVRKSPKLRRLMELAGRYRRVAQSKQRTKVSHGMDDVIGVVQDGDLGRLLPVELSKLGDPDLGFDTLRRLIERQTLCREHAGVEPVAKGPVIITIDESGSMSGEKVANAKALALAMAYIARQQKRWCGLVAYSGDTGERLLVLPPGRVDELALLDWLEPFIGGGSNIDVPLRELPAYYRDQLKAPKGKTDVLMITDAIVSLPSKLVEEFTTWKKKATAKVTTIVIGSEPGDLALVSDEIHRVRAIDAESEAVGSVLSM